MRCITRAAKSTDPTYRGQVTQTLMQRYALDEVVDIYLPMSRLLNLYVAASQQLHAVTTKFLGRKDSKVPFIIGVAGSVAVGKSTTARVLKALLARWPDHRRVDLVTTDGFLRPNAELEKLGLMGRKGFPESFDTARLLNFLASVKSGVEKAEVKFNTGKIEVEHDPARSSVEALVEAVRGTGYQARPSAF